MNTGVSHVPVLFFDGVCNLCNSRVAWIIRHDKKKLFHFATLQSKTGKEALAVIAGKYGHSPDSVILSYNGRYFIKSDAALQTVRFLGGSASLFYCLIVIPRPLRDLVYDLIARKRYKWFGKRQECMTPAPELSARFLSE